MATLVFVVTQNQVPQTIGFTVGGSRSVVQLDVQAAELQVELDLQSNLRLALPQTKEFLEADLSGDIAATLHTAESKPKD